MTVPRLPADPKAVRRPCTTCKGKGTIRINVCHRAPCHACRGRGFIFVDGMVARVLAMTAGGGK